MYSNDNDIAKGFRVEHEKKVTVPELIAEANAIWKKVKEFGFIPNDTERADRCMESIRREHREFCTSYPIVLRYMAQFNEYSSSAFTKYIKYVSVNPWKSESAYLDSMTDYVVLLYKAKHPKWNTTEINNIRSNVRGALEEEHVTFKKTVEKYKDEVDKEEKIINSLKLQELKEWYSKYEDTIDDGHLRAQIDEAISGPLTDVEHLINKIEEKLTLKHSYTSELFELD